MIRLELTAREADLVERGLKAVEFESRAAIIGVANNRYRRQQVSRAGECIGLLDKIRAQRRRKGKGEA